jgi:cell wall-associated NlpC family hydrolase
VLAVTAAIVGTALTGPARADGPTERAAQLAQQVNDLQHQAEAATEAYDAAQGRLAQLVTASSLAEQQAEQAKAQDTQRAAGAETQIRELYMLGGPDVLYVSLFTAGGGSASASVVQGRLLAARGILRADRRAANVAQQFSAAADSAAATATRLATQQSALEADVAAKGDAVRADLARTQQLLASANADVLAAAQADALQRAEAERVAFLQAVAQAQAAAALSSAGLSAAGLGAGLTAPGLTTITPSTVGGAALAAADALSGAPYQWGGNGPGSYDCSGLTKAAYATVGIRLPRTAAEQYQSGPHVPLSQLAPGDLLFWASDPNNPATIEHVAIYAGNGQMMSADHTGDVVRLQPVWWNGYAGATRPGAATVSAAATNPGGGVPSATGQNG